MMDAEGIHEAGYDAGKATGSWVFDGNTTDETLRSFLRMYEDGDPALDDVVVMPWPLSGEWADGPTPQSLAEEFGLSDDETQDACDVYESAFSAGFWDEVVESAQAMVGGDG